MAKHFHPPVFRMPMYGWHADSGILSSSLMCSFDINPSLYITSDRFSFTDKSSSESADDLDLSHCSLTLLLGYGTASYMFSVFVLSRSSLNSSNIYLLQLSYSLYLHSTLTSSSNCLSFLSNLDFHSSQSLVSSISLCWHFSCKSA